MQVDVEVEVKEVKGGNEKEGEGNEKDGVNGESMIETKGTSDDATATTATSSTTLTAATTAPSSTTITTTTTDDTLASTTSQPSQEGSHPALALDPQAVTNQSFFTAVIVPCCQPGNVVCSASQHRYVESIYSNHPILSDAHCDSF